MCLAFSVGITASANTATYLDQQEYSDVLQDRFFEDAGIVEENNPDLGYITYKSKDGYTVTRNYYREEITVEKQPYYESEDRLGYIDELFPNFEFDARDTTIDHIQVGDYIYIRTNRDAVVTYISAFNDYVMRYGKVKSYSFNSGQTADILIEDETGRSYNYRVELYTPVTKGGKSITLSQIKAGDWVKVLVAQRIIGAGIVNEALQEIVVDNDSRYISNVYRGQVASVSTFKKLLNMKSIQKLEKLGWGPYNNLLSISMDAKKAQAYYLGSQVSLDYVARSLKSSGYVYVAAETYMGKENAVKLNFQSKLQNTLPASRVIYSDGNQIKLLSGESLVLATDSMIVRDKRLVEAHSIMVGDMLQAVVSGENRLIVGNISPDLSTGSMEIFRGRIKKITDRETFEVETFSLLNGNAWYFHPTPRTFAIDNETKFYTPEGFQIGGIESFLDYGENSLKDDVFTVIAVGEKAYMVVDMPYTKESLKGQIYEVADDAIKVKDVYYYHTTQKKWMEYSKKNIGITITLEENTVIIKNGKVIPPSQLQKGDKIKAMLETNLKNANGDISGYIIVVEG